MAVRRNAWDKLSKEWQITQMETVVEEITLNELDQRIDKMLTGGNKGRVIVHMQS
jgi:alcohol dehydrogenase